MILTALQEVVDYAGVVDRCSGDAVDQFWLTSVDRCSKSGADRQQSNPPKLIELFTSKSLLAASHASPLARNHHL
ncbi:hypothetical protein F2Q70_00004181 [Brassica cretica]|uniref:Uncharacterized protein n=1 Tax=Brassica cretica TaxID=69181 RepID=A0A8S9J0M5_BRACR|nr:hypothetical protein F2Q70_00004181 [Brassica cretica]